jgi:hypothetical protein
MPNVGISLCLNIAILMISFHCDMTNAGTYVPAFSAHQIVNYFATISTFSVASTPSNRVAVAVAEPTSFKCSLMCTT